MKIAAHWSKLNIVGKLSTVLPTAEEAPIEHRKTRCSLEFRMSSFCQEAVLLDEHFAFLVNILKDDKGKE
jgi:hypothetical protein